VKDNNTASGRASLIAEFKQSYVCAGRRWTEAVARGHDSRLPPPDELGAILDAMRFAEVALQVIDRVPKQGRRSSEHWYDDLLAECLEDAGPVVKNARTLFLARAEERRKIGLPSAENRLREAWNRRFPKGAPSA
jgi:hypothetical protein